MRDTNAWCSVFAIHARENDARGIQRAMRQCPDVRLCASKALTHLAVEEAITACAIRLLSDAGADCGMLLGKCNRFLNATLTLSFSYHCAEGVVLVH